MTLTDLLRTHHKTLSIDTPQRATAWQETLENFPLDRVQHILERLPDLPRPTIAGVRKLLDDDRRTEAARARSALHASTRCKHGHPHKQFEPCAECRAEAVEVARRGKQAVLAELRRNSEPATTMVSDSQK